MMEISELFRHACVKIISEQKRGAQSHLADSTGISRTLMSDYLKGRKPLSESKRALIADALEYTYEEMITMGRNIIGKSPKEKGLSTPVEPLDRAIEILRLAEEKAGKKLNTKQREAVATIIRKELKKRESEAMGNVVDMIKALQ